ncbi:unnamed protein product [Phaedon cochleariae]|uniref:Cytochrome P450 n=1 Tax=Phaedon cochleariae TaxID=80249 RepID=A0A9N9X322_PHACE|nr:unnamed protein product [Phaedon cochleariae]
MIIDLQVIRNKMEKQKMMDQSENLTASTTGHTVHQLIFLFIHSIVDSGTRLSFIDLLMKSKSLTEEELNDEVGTILAAGSETSATTLEYLMITLGMNQDIQDKVYEEVMEIMGPNRPVEPQDLMKLKYTEMALKETLRIFPTVPFVIRSVETDLRLDHKHTIPEGASVLILFLAIHRDPKYWPDPFKFDPDRFLPENKTSRHAFSYLPFMGGPRNCIEECAIVQVGIEMHTGHDLRLIELICLRAVNVRYHIDLIWRLSPAGRSWNKPLKLCRDFNSLVIRNKMKNQEIEDESGNFDVDSERKPSFIELMMRSGSFTEQELNDEVGTILAAGSETSASTLEHMMITLGMNQDIQDKVYEEVMEIMGPDKSVEPQDLAKLTFTDLVLKETMRILPTVPFVLRSVETDLRLDDTHTIPGGASVIIFILAIHRDPNYWPDPFKFDPDRFLPGNKTSRHAFSYLPFMGGPRNCIGGRYAMMSVMTMFVHLIRKYRFFTEYKSLEEIRVIPLVTLKLKDGAKLSMKRR